MFTSKELDSNWNIIINFSKISYSYNPRPKRLDIEVVGRLILPKRLDVRVEGEGISPIRLDVGVVGGAGGLGGDRFLAAILYS